MERREFQGNSHIEADMVEAWGEGVRIGPDVLIEVKRLRLGRNVCVGVLDDDDAFRKPGGVRIRADALVIGDGVRIGRQVLVRGGDIELGRNCRVGNDCTLKVSKRLVLGVHGIINDQCEIAGVDVQVGRELWMISGAKIGGGSAFEPHSALQAGHWLHLGARTLVNTARRVILGDEVGLGTGTSLYTHGAYPSALDGKPVAFGSITIGDRSWLPGAIVNPSVNIGADCVIGVGSVVTKDVPSGALAGGVPAKIIKEGVYPRPLTDEQRRVFLLEFLQTFGEICADQHPVEYSLDRQDPLLRIGGTMLIYAPDARTAAASMPEGAEAAILLTYGDKFDRVEPLAPWTLVDLGSKRLAGAATPLTERLLNQLRRYGIRFNFEAVSGEYRPWQ